VPAEIMAGIYRGILTRIEASGYDVFTKPIRVPRPVRAWIAAATWARTQLLRV
jgi:phytoene/squalene synthetase